ncbi:fibronectin type III-like domain-contianing protein [Enterococcus gallinarum]|uniref:fibronectin type III-like domain-contianing protein n=1 Tax=Enterococcus gallinarum TaxID=1353 RepID=UPI003A5237F9
MALQPGESETVVFQIEEEMLKFYNSKGKHESETGKFDIFIGTDSQTHNKETIYLKKTS